MLKKKKITRMNLIGLRQSYVVLSDGEQRELVGCGSGTFNDPYTKEEFWGMMADLNHPWTGGYVMGMGYFMPEWNIYYSSTNNCSSANNNVISFFDDASSIYRNLYGAYEDAVNTVTEAVNGFTLNFSVKKYLFDMIKGCEMGKTAQGYIRFTKAAFKGCGITGVALSAARTLNDPSPKNIVNTAITVSATVLGPGGTVVFTILDMSGTVDYVSEKIAEKIEEYM